MHKKLSSMAAILLVATIIFSLCGCTPTTEKVTDTAFVGYEFSQMKAENIPVTYTPLNMATQYMTEMGIYGDGCQWPVSFESSLDGKLMLYGIDVAGMYRSLDGGVTWQKCVKGVTSRGLGMFGIDPKNSNHVLAVGLSGSSAQNTGMYISYDGCDSWEPTGFNVKIGGERYLWDGLEFDGTTFDQSAGICLTAYYSIPFERDRTTRKNAYQSSNSESKLKEGEQGLYKSVDGGKSFTQISDDARLSDGIVKVTENGNLLIGNQHGLFHVNGQGQIVESWLTNTFSDYETDKITITLRDGKTADILKCYLGVTGLDCVGNTIYAQTWDGIFTFNFDGVRKDSRSALSPNLITNQNYKSQNWPQFVAVSKSNPQHIVYQYRGRVDKVSWDTYWTNYVDVSFDGGQTWQTAQGDMKSVFTNGGWAAREKLLIVDPTNDDNVLCFGSDTIMRSSDGGKNFQQASGVSNMMCGGKMHFNYFDDQIIFFGAQDYAGAVSLDGGQTFERIKIVTENETFGHCYDGFAADYQTYFGFARPSWTGENNLVITFDGGQTWKHTGIRMPYGEPTITLQSYNNPDVLFAGCYRSVDRGRSWKKMKDCICVCTVSYGKGHELFGYDKDRNIVMSADDGQTWKVVFDRTANKFNDSPRTVDETIKDLSFDFVNNIVYAVVSSHHRASDGSEYNSQAFYKVQLNENFQFENRSRLPVFDGPDGYENITDIEVDPNATNVIYTASAGNYFSNRYALQRSVDGGQTWQVLTANTDTEPSKKGLCINLGGFEASMLAVSPLTGKVLVGCGCYGFEWINPPYESSKLNHSAPAEHTVTFVCDGKTVHREKVKNNRSFDYFYDTDGQTFVGWYTDKALTHPWKEGTRVYNSTVLYAKMKKAQQVVFNVNGSVFSTFDLEYGKSVEVPVPQMKGYVFGGWFADKALTKKADFHEITQTTNVFAGFYKTEGDVFDPTEKDFAAYLQYSNHKLSSTDRVDDEQVDNRCAFIKLQKDTTYLLTFQMDNRCRYGLTGSEFVANRVPEVYFVHEKDTNTSGSVKDWVYLTFGSGQCEAMLVFYYTANSESGIDYREIRSTIHCYKLLDENMQYLLD